MESENDYIVKDFSSRQGGESSGQMGEERVANGNFHNPILHSDTPESALRKVQTSSSVTISSELFEKLYLQPHMRGSTHPLQKILGNPTPLAIIGFEMSLMPITMDLMGWRGSGGAGASDNADVVFYGGVLMWVGGLLEFILGNTFPFVVFMSFGSFYISYGAAMIPLFATYSAYSAHPTTDPTAGLTDPTYLASYGMYFVVFTILMFYYTICVLRTNVVFVLMFLTITPAVALIAALYFYAAAGNASQSHNCQVAAGALLFVTCILGWYLLAGLLLPSVDFPLLVPLGDLSHVVPGLSDIRARRERGGKRSAIKKSQQETDSVV